MGANLASAVLTIEDNMTRIIEGGLADAPDNLWWDKVTKIRNGLGRKEVLEFLVSDVQIRDLGEGGNIRYSDIADKLLELEHRVAGEAFKISRDEIKDSSAPAKADRWARDIATLIKYWVQEKTAYALMNGHTASILRAYDGKALFATDHPINPVDSSKGTFSNLFTGSSAVPIDTSVAADVALANMSKVFAAIAAIKMPNGKYPRRLRPGTILCGPKLFPRVCALLEAKILPATAGAAGTAGGAADFGPMVAAMGYGKPVLAHELAGFESDTTWFVIPQQFDASEVGGLLYSERDPFEMTTYGPSDTPALNRQREFEWQMMGRNTLVAGHPYLAFKCKAS